MIIYCCGCQKEVEARLTNGAEIYPHRRDLRNLPFWRCDACRNYVGCHHKNKSTFLLPVGNIPTPDIREARKRIHAILDPLWRTGKIKRGKLYATIAQGLGAKQYHTGEIKTLDEALTVLRLLNEINYRQELTPCKP